LDKKYAYDWSQGVGETMTFIIPNAYGSGGQGLLDEKSNVAKYFIAQGAPADQAGQIAASLPTYWGEKPFTSGPWYFGVGVVFLFILGLFIVKSRLKWWILTTTILVLLLSFGRHFPLVSDIFFDYFPMYNKFRAVESILIVVSVLIPMFAILTVNEIINKADHIPHLNKRLLYTFAVMGGFILLVALMPDLFLSFKNSQHQQLIESFGQQMQNQNAGAELAAALVKDRASLASKDAYRSFALLLIVFGLLWFYIKKKESVTVLIVGLGVVFLVDLWSVDKRYLNDATFVDAKAMTRQVFVEREVDQLIRMDKDLSYRVFDLTTNPFSDARTSYFHKSLGGYHAAKLMRFQEIVDHQFNGAINEDVLDMFNVRYIISQEQNSGERINRRSTAAGNAWFVDRVTFVKDNAQEMQAISSFDPKKEAFVHEQFRSKIEPKRLGQPGANADIKLVAYHPDKMEYEYTAPNDAFAVFSEVYYDKGWKAYVDGEEVPILRADYILRALQLPGGNHKVEFRFEPTSAKLSAILSLIGSIILVGGLGLLIYFRSRHKDANNKTDYHLDA